MAFYELVLQGPNNLRRSLLYDPDMSRFIWADSNEPLDLSGFAGRRTPPNEWAHAFPVSPSNPARKSRAPKNLKIQLGLKCNYACTYCNQRAQPQDSEAHPRAVARFLKKLPEWFSMGDGEGHRIEFWGGEPFVYWKTLKPLAEGIRTLYPKVRFNIITNGSLFDQEKIDWLYDLGFGVGISHDGPAYEAGRGADPLLEPEQCRWIRYAYDRLFGEGRIGFNAVLSNKNVSLFTVRHHIAKHLGIPLDSVPVTTEEILLPYDAGGMSMSVLDNMTEKRLIHTTFYEAITGWSSNIVQKKASEFLQASHIGRPAAALGQKCGMDREDNIAIDLNGNVMTCQNTSPLTKHRIGHLDAFDAIRLKTAHHWSTRAECGKCPVLQLCQGACLFVEDDYWQQACKNSFAYNLGVLAAALFMATRYVLIEVIGEDIHGKGLNKVDAIEAGFLDAPLPAWYFGDGFRRTQEHAA